MPIYHDIYDFHGALLPNSRLLAIDVGTTTWGLATSDLGLMIASPLKVISTSRFSDDATEIAALILRENICGLVVGLPLNLDGTMGPRAQSCEQFAKNLKSFKMEGDTPFSEIPILMWDERFSTAAVERMMIEEADLSRRKRDQVVDKLAAAHMLQGVLDAIKYHTDAIKYGHHALTEDDNEEK